MKKRITAIALVVALTAIAIVGATLAYFTSEDSENNTFTVGNVKIELTETFTDGSKLLPGSDVMNTVQKEVFVTSTGTEAAYVRVHIAIPTILATDNVLHLINSNVATGQWNWSADTYTTVIDEIEYKVFVVTYETALEKDVKTPAAIDKVYLDGKTTNEDIVEINKTLGTTWQIKVVAEGVQADGFKDAYEAFETAFGKTPTSPWAVTVTP